MREKVQQINRWNSSGFSVKAKQHTAQPGSVPAHKVMCVLSFVILYTYHNQKKADKNKGKACLPLTVKRKRVILLTVGGGIDSWQGSQK